jgi:hypothetical protein
MAMGGYSGGMDEPEFNWVLRVTAKVVGSLLLIAGLVALVLLIAGESIRRLGLW